MHRDLPGPSQTIAHVPVGKHSVTIATRRLFMPSQSHGPRTIVTTHSSRKPAYGLNFTLSNAALLVANQVSTRVRQAPSIGHAHPKNHPRTFPNSSSLDTRSQRPSPSPAAPPVTKSHHHPDRRSTSASSHKAGRLDRSRIRRTRKLGLATSPELVCGRVVHVARCCSSW